MYDRHLSSLLFSSGCQTHSDMLLSCHRSWGNVTSYVSSRRNSAGAWSASSLWVHICHLSFFIVNVIVVSNFNSLKTLTLLAFAGIFGRFHNPPNYVPFFWAGKFWVRLCPYVVWVHLLFRFGKQNTCKPVSVCCAFVMLSKVASACLVFLVVFIFFSSFFFFFLKFSCCFSIDLSSFVVVVLITNLSVFFFCFFLLSFLLLLCFDEHG